VKAGSKKWEILVLAAGGADKIKPYCEDLLGVGDNGGGNSGGGNNGGGNNGGGNNGGGNNGGGGGKGTG
jgi:hypothetical protein